MITVLLTEKIASLFLVMLIGIVLAKCGLLRQDETKSLSVIMLYLITPCVILTAFQINFSPEIRDGFLLALLAAVLVHMGLLAAVWGLGRLFHLSGLERAAVLYSNAGNLIIPIVIAVLGEGWVVYTSAFIIVQLFLIWSHGKMLLCGEKKIEFKKILLNVNMIAVFVGLILCVTGVRFPRIVQDAVSSIGGMIGPLVMITTGVMIGSASWKNLFAYKRLWLIVSLRLIVCPIAVAIALKYSGLAMLATNGRDILLITLLAASTSSSGGLTQMALFYGSEAAHAVSIYVVTTVLCSITMPVMVMLYLL